MNCSIPPYVFTLLGAMSVMFGLLVVPSSKRSGWKAFVVYLLSVLGFYSFFSVFLLIISGK